MCGIAGMLSLTERPLENPDLVRTITSKLIHRGPDEEGFYVNPSVKISLGHRRLRIIDLSTGRQPLGNADRSVMISFNGEIYGFRKLRESLEARGHKFQTNTDTETIVYLYEEQGIKCLDQLKGMFAFAIWDELAETLFIARDRIGKKPLYYTTCQGMFLFASELDALMSVPAVSRDLDDLALDEYLTLGYIPAPRTIYRHIKKLEAGHFLKINGGNVENSRFWAPQSRTNRSIGLEEAKYELARRIRTATVDRMVSDVPLGCFLSGGVDSSTVLSFMAEVFSGPVKTFSIGFPEEEFSELPYARTVARQFGTDHHEFVLEPAGVCILDELVTHFGEPFADSSALPTWYLSKLTRKFVTVALTGDGGDELFGGYAWYQTFRLLEGASFIPPSMARLASSLTSMAAPKVIKRLGKAAFLLSLTSGQRHAALRQIISPQVKESLYSQEFSCQVATQALDGLANQYEQIHADDPLNRAMATDLVSYMPEDLLVKVDRTSMAHALECRSPLLDTDLVAWVLNLPSSYKMSWNEGKWLLRETVKDRFPSGFLDRPKQGFTVPLERWFRNGLRKVVMERVLNGPLGGMRVFDPVGLKWIVEEHFSGRANHQALVWALLFLASWREHYGH